MTSKSKFFLGDWKNNLMHGQGTLTLVSSQQYQGQWAKGKQHGQGTLLSKASEKTGEWKEGKYVG